MRRLNPKLLKKIEQSECKQEKKIDFLERENLKLLDFCLDGLEDNFRCIFLEFACECQEIFIEMTCSMRSQSEIVGYFHDIVSEKMKEVLELNKIIAKSEEIKFYINNSLHVSDFFEKGRLFDTITTREKETEISYNKLENQLRTRINRDAKDENRVILSRKSELFDWGSVCQKHLDFISESKKRILVSKEKFDHLAEEHAPWIDYKYLNEQNYKLTQELNSLKRQLPENYVLDDSYGDEDVKISEIDEVYSFNASTTEFRRYIVKNIDLLYKIDLSRLNTNQRKFVESKMKNKSVKDKNLD